MTTTNQSQEFLLQTIQTLLGSERVAIGDFQPGKLAVWDYSRPAHFNALWSAFSKNSLSAVDRVLIIWDGTPLDSALHPINTTDQVSALHWAVCASEKCVQDLRITILDLNPSARKSNRLYRQFLCCDKETFNWLRVCQAGDLFKLLGTRETQPAKETMALRFFSEKINDREHRNASFFLDAIREELTSPIDPSNRHAIANIIGPMLLLQAKPSIERSMTDADHGEALKHILTATKLIEKSDNVGSPYSDIETIHQGRNVRVILVDDQAKHGWFQWLSGCVRRFLPEATVVSLSVTDLARRLSDSMDNLSPSKGDKRFSLRLSEDSHHQEDEILCLDLRLFSGGERKQESAFYSHIWELWRRLKDRATASTASDVVGNDSSQPALAWPDNISPDEAAVQRWCESDGSEADHQATITILPRLIAQLDMAYPVVLFSSTGQGSMLKRLQDHGNVILEFEKPRFFDPQDASVVRHQAILRLRNSLSKALFFLEARRRCAWLEAHAAAWKSTSQPCRLPLTDNRYHVELFMDETGSGRELKLGGLFAIFENPETPIILADAFDDTLVEHGVRYFDSLGIGVQPLSRLIKPKTETCAAEFNSALEKWNAQGYAVHLGFVQIGGIHPFPEANDMFARTDFADNRWRFALTALLELFLRQTLPAIFGPRMESRVSISIFAPTRLLACDEQSAKDYEHRFGWTILRRSDGEFVRSENQGLLVRVFSRNDLYDVLSAIPQRQMPDYDLQRALAVRLVYQAERAGRSAMPEYWISGKSLVRPSPSAFASHDDLKAELERVSPMLSSWRADLRSLHYVCDQYLRDRRGFDAISKSPLNGQFREALDEDLASALKCRRSLAEGRLADAVSDLPLPYSQSRHAISMIAADIGDSLWRMKGPDFCRVAARLASRPTQTLPRLESRISIHTATADAGSTTKQYSAAERETKVPILKQSKEPTDALENNVPLFRTRYCVHFPELPNDFTEPRLQNLLHGFTEEDGSTLVVPSSLYKRSGFVWFKSEGVAELVFLRTRRAWGSELFVSPPFNELGSKDTPEGGSTHAAETQAAVEVPAGGETVTAPESPPTGILIKIAGVPIALEPSALRDRLRRFGLTQIDLRQRRSTRGSKKYEAEFLLSRTEAARFIDDCGGVIRLGDTECSVSCLEIRD